MSRFKRYLGSVENEPTAISDDKLFSALERMKQDRILSLPRMRIDDWNRIFIKTSLGEMHYLDQRIKHNAQPSEIYHKPTSFQTLNS